MLGDGGPASGKSDCRISDSTRCGASAICSRTSVSAACRAELEDRTFEVPICVGLVSGDKESRFLCPLGVFALWKKFVATLHRRVLFSKTVSHLIWENANSFRSNVDHRSLNELVLFLKDTRWED